MSTATTDVRHPRHPAAPNHSYEEAPARGVRDPRDPRRDGGRSPGRVAAQPGGLARARGRLDGHRPHAHPGEGVGGGQLRDGRQAHPRGQRAGRDAACWPPWPASSRSAPSSSARDCSCCSSPCPPSRRCPGRPPPRRRAARPGDRGRRARGARLAHRRRRVAAPQTSRARRDASTGPQRRTVLVLGAAAVAMGVAGQWVTTVRTRISDVVLPRPSQAADALPEGLEATVRRHHRAAHAQRRVLPRRHPPDRADRGRGRLDADHRRRRRAGAHLHLRRDRRDAADRARHHPDLRQQRGRRHVRRRRPVARRAAHRPPRDGRRRRPGRPDPVHRRGRHEDQHAAGGRHRRPRHDGRHRHERPAAARASTASRPAW